MRLTEKCKASASFVEESIAAWHGSSPKELPHLGRRYSKHEQHDREILFDQALQIAETELQTLPGTRSGRNEAYDRLTSAVARVAAFALDVDDPYIASLLRKEFSAVGKQLACTARHFDASVSLCEILQACRNAWTACGLQPLLGQPLQLTPAIFGYSMLYPYSDNYLDDAGVSQEAKLRFSSRFRRRLAGCPPPPADSLETAVWRLVSFIESQYARSDYPQIYNCLLDIHAAQEKSIQQLGCSTGGNDIDLLRLTFEKGGMSVLADAHLAAGSLTDCEARFAFFWGVLLQCADDMDDLPLDRQNAFRNLFTEAAKCEPLDELTNRTLNFGQSVIKLMQALPNGSARFKDLLQRNLSLLIIRAAGNSGELFTKTYLHELETYSPLRFQFLKQRHQHFAARAGLYTRCWEALFVDGDEPPFPALSWNRQNGHNE